jgi:hypothetical protein
MQSTPFASSRTIRTAVAGLVVAVTIAVSVISAAALPRDPGDGSGPPPPPPRRTTTTTRGPVYRFLSGFTLTTDSVVATAVVSYTGTPGTVTVRWGDNTSSSVSGAQVPAGSVTFVHGYTAPMDGSAFTEVVTAQTDTDTDTRVVLVQPRFRVTQFQATFRPLEHCDSFAETYTEWRVQSSMTTNGQTSNAKTWRKDLQTNNTILPGPSIPLTGSETSVDLTMADPPPYLMYSSTELDPIWDDAGAGGLISLDPRLGSRHVSLGSQDCVSEITADVDVQLLRPGLPGSALMTAWF